MNMKTSWVAVRGVDKARVLECFDLIETGEVETVYFPDLGVAELPGWTVLQSGKFDFFKPKAVAAAVKSGEAFGGQAYDVVMYSAAYGIVDGKQVWSVVHDVDKTPRDVIVEGTPPAEFRAVLDQLRRAQAEPGNENVDHIFDAPIVLTAALCGYRPDFADPTLPAVDFRLVEPALKGRAGERQRAALAFQDRLSRATELEVIPVAEALGFQRASALPPEYPRPNSPTMLVRFRDGRSEIIDFHPDWRGGEPQIAISLFVRNGTEFRNGRVGRALTPAPGRSFMDVLRGRREDPEQALARSVRDARELIDVVDRYLKDGTSDPRLTPPLYDEAR